MYSVHKNNPFYSTLTLLQICYWYPRENGKRYMIFFWIVSGILRTISLLTAYGTTVHIYLILRDNVDVDVSEGIGDVAGATGCMSVAVTFMLHHDKWSKVFNDLVDFKQFGKPPKYEEVVKRGNSIAFMCIIYTVPGLIWYCFVAYLQIPQCEAQNIRKGLNIPCGMPNQTWLPSSVKTRSQFLIFYILQILGVLFYVSAAFALCVLPMEAVEVHITKIRHLKVLFRDALSTNDKKLGIKQLHHCIRYHQDIIRVSKKLSTLVKASSGNALITAGFVIGAFGSQLIQETIPKVISYVFAYTLGIFFVCHAGQRLMDESLELADYVYDSKWYEMDPKIKHNVLLILARCQKPMNISAPPLMGLAGHVLFSAMMKTAFSYLTLLNQMV